MHTKLTIFDCDGTLVDSEYLNNLATIEILHEQGLLQYDMQYAYQHFVGRKLSAIMADISRDTGHIFLPDTSARYVARAAALLPTLLKPVPGARELVIRAAECGGICVASNGERANVIESLRLCGLKDFFVDKSIYTAIEVQNPKPAPDLFLHAARLMGVDPANTAVIEDSVVGVTAGVAAGMHVIGFTGTHHDPAAHENALRKAGAHEISSNLIHIRDRLFNQNA